MSATVHPGAVCVAAGAATPRRAVRMLFVNHASRVAGAEMILLDIARDRGDGSRVFLFEDGPMRLALAERGIAASVSRHAGDLARVKRDRSLLRAAPMLLRLVATAAEIARAARRHDAVYANSQKAFVLSALAACVARRPLIWHLHDILSPAHFGAMQRRLVVFLANHFAARVIVPSRSAADAFVDAGGRTEIVRVVPNGLDLPDAPEAEEHEAARIAAGLPGGFLFGVFSRLAPWKGQHIAIQALAALPDARLAIVGDALFGEDAYAARLRFDAETLGVADRVTFLGHRRDVPALMRLVDVVVHPSVDAEPFGRTLVEAMLCRTPVVATSAGAVPDILDGGRAGILVPPADAGALAAALARLRERPADCAAMVEGAQARAKDFYGLARMRAGTDKVIGDLLAGPPR